MYTVFANKIKAKWIKNAQKERGLAQATVLSSPTFNTEVALTFGPCARDHAAAAGAVS